MPDRPKGEECVGSGLEGALAPPFTQLISQDDYVQPTPDNTRTTP